MYREPKNTSSLTTNLNNVADIDLDVIINFFQINKKKYRLLKVQRTIFSFIK